MNGPGDIPTTNGTTIEKPCGITSIIPSFGMSCRGRAEAFARRLQSRLRTLGSQTEDSPTSEENPIINSGEHNTWITQDGQQQVTSLQPLRHGSNEADSFFDFDCEPESPGSPADECEYSRLIETASTTPQNDCAPESGYICASPITTENGSLESQSSSDGVYFDPESSEGDQRSLPTDYYDCDESKRENKETILLNGHCNEMEANSEIDIESDIHIADNDNSESLTESLPPSQESTPTNATSTTHSSSTFTGISSMSNNTLQDVVLAELQQTNNVTLKLANGHHDENGIENIEDIEETSSATDQENITNGCVDNLIVKDQNIPEQILIRATPELESQDTENKEKNDNDNIKHLSVCDTDDDDDCRPQRVRRCSSLKTGKTPPGTPGRKKIVRFADVLGLDLADVKTFLDEIPTIPKSAYEDLEIIENTEPVVQLGPRADKILMPLFQQPGGLPSFLDVVREKQVSLENAAVIDPINLTITGSVRVRNLDFHKSVHIRYTLDSWRSYADLKANYVQNSCDGFSDKFSFTLFGNSMNVGQRMEIAVRFQCRGEQFWDNNYGSNYCFQCLPASNPVNKRPIIPHHHASAILSPHDWCGSFY